MHWGGGSPNILTATHIRGLAERLREHFHLLGGAEFAVEIDPRHVAQPQVDAFAAAGVSRIFFGIQDFEPAVQTAINRIQPFEVTRRAVEMFRDRGIASVNLDIVYGLPHQTVETAERTIDLLLQLKPDRIAAFGYAHLPSRLTHQRLIDEAVLPGPQERYRLAELIGDRLVEAGFVRIGLDHFARPEDTLATRPLARNFQGYTIDKAATLIGLGASSIGRIGPGYTQNATPLTEYMRRIEKDGLAVARGFEMGEEDRIRAFAIERLMCDLAFCAQATEQRFGPKAAILRRDAARLIAADRDRLVEATAAGFRVTERGRPFLRTICSEFDRYYQAGTTRHAAGV